MISKYIDKANGGIVLLDEPAHSGLNIDVDGAHHFLVQMGESYYDATTGMVLTSEFTILASKITWVGTSALPATNISTGTRKSLDANTIDRAVDEVDQWTRSGIPMISSLAAATNSVTTVLTDWTEVLSNITNEGDYTYKINDDNSSGTGSVIAQDSITVDTASPYTFTALCKKDQLGWVYLRGQSLTDPTSGGVWFDLTNGVVGTEQVGYIGRISHSGDGWYLCSITFTTTTDTEGFARVYLADSDGSSTVDLDGTSSIFVRDPRCVQSSAPAAPFPDGSAAGASVGVDAVKASHTYGANTTFYISRKSYGWVDSDNPVDAEPVIVKAGAMEIRVNAGGFIETSGGAISTKKTDGNWQTIIVKVGGGNHSIQIDDETPVVAASAVVPSGTTYLCNNTAGTKVDHSADIAGIYPILSTTADDAVFISGISAITDGQVFQ